MRLFAFFTLLRSETGRICCAISSALAEGNVFVFGVFFQAFLTMVFVWAFAVLLLCTVDAAPVFPANATTFNIAVSLTFLFAQTMCRAAVRREPRDRLRTRAE